MDTLRRLLRQQSLPLGSDDVECKVNGQQSADNGELSSSSRPTVGSSRSNTDITKSSDDKSNYFVASFPTLVMLAVVLILVILGRQYIVDVLIYIDSLHWWESLFLFVIMFTVVAFPVMSGYVLLNIACGYTYGFIYGALVTSACAGLAIASSHLVMRRFCKRHVETTYIINSQTRALMDVVSGRNGNKIVFLMRFTPIPFGLQNAIFAVSGVKTLPYVIISMLGLALTQLAYAYMGSKFRSLAEIFSSDNSTATWILLSAQLIITFGLTIFVLVLAKRQLEKDVPSSAATSATENKGSQTTNSTDKKMVPDNSNKPRSHSRNMSVNIPPILANSIHIV